ncbi:MAG TPA: L-threonine 3-dehydrogenase [Acholeplasmataceae bacterium]|jgi:threonine 3-dehydrogenase|nr:L-threonine 3-dehydrogenase [Acholeplasmataceae bacterium]
MISLSDEAKTLEMLAVVKEKPEKGFSLKKVTISTDLKADEVLVKVYRASFCGTDYHLYTYDDYAKGRIKLPLIVGHEFSGEIIKIGMNVNNLKVGDVVSAESHIICEECEFCRRGEGHICVETKVLGLDTDGCFANYVKLPAANCFVNSKDINPLFLSVQEPLGNAVHTMAHFPIKDKNVVILGCGPIGLLAVDVAKAYGARKVIAIEVKPYRETLALEIGADVVINPTREDVVLRVLEETGGLGADVIGEFTGNKQAIEQAFKYLKAGGAISMLGLPSEKIELDFSHDVVHKGISIYGVTGRRIYDTWHQVRELVESGKLHLDKIITHELPLREINRAGEIMGSGNCGKIVLIPEEIDE